MGLVVTSIAPAPSYFITVQRLRKETFIANVIYDVTLDGLNFTPSEECRELRFVDLAEMGTLNLYPTARRFYEVLQEQAAHQ